MLSAIIAGQAQKRLIIALDLHEQRAAPQNHITTGCCRQNLLRNGDISISSQQAAKQPQWRNGGLLGQEHLRCKKRGSHDLSTVFDLAMSYIGSFSTEFLLQNYALIHCTPIYINKHMYIYIKDIFAEFVEHVGPPLNSKSFTVLLHETKENYLCLIPGSCCISPLFIVAP